MISEHKRFIRKKNQIISEKEEALESARLRYLAEQERILRQFNSRLTSHSQQLSREILHELR